MMNRWVLGVAFIALASAAAVLWAGGTSAQEACPASKPTDLAAGTSEISRDSPRVKLQSNKNSEAWNIRLDRDRDVQRASFSFETNGSEEMDLTSPIKAFIPDDLISEDDYRIPAKEPASSFIVAAKPVRLDVTACFSPSKDLKPGLYRGTLQISGRTIEPVSIPITVSVKDHSIVLPIVVLVSGSLFGIFLKIVSAMQQTSGISRAAARKYVLTWGFLSGVLLGCVGLGFVWMKLYAENRAFSGDFSHLWPLAVGAAGAFLATTTVTDIVPKSK